MRSSALHWLGILISVALFIIGIAGIWDDALRAQAFLHLTWQEFALILFAVISAVFNIQLWRKLNQLEKSQPRVTVKPLVSQDRRIILEVINDGFGGDFSANARIRSGPPIKDSIDLQWEANGQTRCHIDGGGGVANLLVAVETKDHEFDAIHQKPPTLLHSGELKLLTVKGGEPLALILYRMKYDASSSEIPQYECIVEISITSDPALLKPFKRRPYKIEMRGTHITFTETTDHHNESNNVGYIKEWVLAKIKSIAVKRINKLKAHVKKKSDL